MSKLSLESKFKPRMIKLLLLNKNRSLVSLLTLTWCRALLRIIRSRILRVILNIDNQVTNHNRNLGWERSTTSFNSSASPLALQRTHLPFPLWGGILLSPPAKMLPIRDPPYISTSKAWELTARPKKEGILNKPLGLEAIIPVSKSNTWISQFTKLNKELTIPRPLLLGLDKSSSRAIALSCSRMEPEHRLHWVLLTTKSIIR